MLKLIKHLINYNVNSQFPLTFEDSNNYITIIAG